MSIHWAAAKTTWTAHTKGQQVYCLRHLHPMRVTMDIEVNKAPKQIELYIGFASHVFTRKLEIGEDPDPADLYRNEREPRRLFDVDRYELSLRLPVLVRRLCEGALKCYFGKDNNFFVFQSLEDPETEYRAFFDVARWREQGTDAMVLVIQSAYRARTGIQAPRGRGDKPIRFKVLLTRVMEGRRPRPPR